MGSAALRPIAAIALVVAMANGCASADRAADRAAQLATPSSLAATVVPAGATDEVSGLSPSGSPGVASTDLVVPDRHLIATVRNDSIDVFDAPGGARIVSMTNPLPSGAELNYLVLSEADAWLEVLLPIRPNGTSGWIERSSVDLSSTRYRIEVRLSEHDLTVYEEDRILIREPVAVGRQPNPTPGGVHYLLELVQPPDPGGVYGPFAYGLSGFSEQLTSFNGGDGRLGLHGTNDPSTLGQDVSAGCIRVSNEVITALAGVLPLGTPLVILP